MNNGEVIPPHRVKELLKEHVQVKLEREVRGLECQRKLLNEMKNHYTTVRERVLQLLSTSRLCPMHIIAGSFELYDQLLPEVLLQ